MKKILSVFLCMVMVLAAASCDTTEETKKTKQNGETHSEQKIDSDKPVLIEASEIDVNSNSGFDPDFTFTTTDRDGNTWDESTFSSYKLTMINFWEPWCGPCVGEIPDLERLYEDYKDKGFQIIGVYSEESMEEDVDEILRDSKVSYPILHYTTEFDQFQSGYVPTTIFVDGNGHVLKMPNGDPNVIGSNSYNDWASIIDKLL